MARGGCRDCGRCTESWAQWLAFEWIRFLFWICGGFLLNFFLRGCPECGHRLWHHWAIARSLPV